MSIPAEPVIGFPCESTPGDRRTLLTPTVARVLCEAGFGVLTESAIGTGVFCADVDLAAQGVRFTGPDKVWAAPLVLRYKSADPGELSRLRPGQVIGALFHAEGDPALVSALAASKVTAYSYEFVEEDGQFPLAKPGGEIAGIQATPWCAATRAGAHLLLFNRIASADPDFPVVWTYIGQTRRTPPCL